MSGNAADDLEQFIEQGRHDPEFAAVFDELQRLRAKQRAALRKHHRSDWWRGRRWSRDVCTTCGEWWPCPTVRELS